MKRSHLGLICGIGSTKLFNFGPKRTSCAKEPSFVNQRLLGELKNWIFDHKSTSYLLNISSLYYARGFCSEVSPKLSGIAKFSAILVAKAQEALMDYLHGTRGLHFTDAEHMSRYSPTFLAKILKKVEHEEDIGRALDRFFRYHPINEFEPFFESIGLKHSEFASFLPRHLMFLSDDELLIENFHVLCNYGFARGRIGKIYKEATDIFRYDYGILQSKLQAYEGLGISKTNVIKVVTSSPILLVGGVNEEFLKVLKELEDMGIQQEFLIGALSEKNVYKWGNIFVLLQFLIELGFAKKDLGALIRRQPGFLLDGSGNMMFSLVTLLLKSGGTENKIFSFLSEFPNIQIGIFMRNLRRGMMFLMEIEMDKKDIQEILLSHTTLLGSCPLKRPNSILTYLSTSKKRLCRIIKEDPGELKKYALGMKVNPLPHLVENERSLEEKNKFLLSLGFVKGSKEMQKALSVFRGKGDELQERYDFLVKTGLSPSDVSNMIKMSPHVLNQKINVLENKISFLVNDLGYPLNSLVAFPSYMSYTVERANLRFSMYNWLKDRGKVKPQLALSSILACSDKVFLKRYVNLDPEGPKAWQNLKKSLS